MGLIVYQGEKSTMVGFDSRLVEAELMCLKSFANVPHVDRVTPLKTDARELESELWHWKDIDICLMILLCAKDSRKGKMSMVRFGKWDAHEVVGSISEETHDQRGTVGPEICQTG